MEPMGLHEAGYNLPPEREVDCTCDVRLHRPVLRDHTGINERVSACLCCGTITFTESLVVEPHPNDVQCVANQILPLSLPLQEWLSAWPRLAWGVWQQDRRIYLPAGLRAADVIELEAAERSELVRQSSLSLRERLRYAGYPVEPPPSNLPPTLKQFPEIQEGLLLTPETDRERLIELADRRTWASLFAQDILASFPDRTEMVVGLLHSKNQARLSSGLSLIQNLKLSEPPILAALIELLSAAPLSEQALHPLLDTFATLGPAAADAKWALTTLCDRVGSGNYYLHKRIDQVRSLVSPPELRTR